MAKSKKKKSSISTAIKPTIKHTYYDPGKEKLHELMDIPEDEVWRRKVKTRRKVQKFLDEPITARKGRKLTRLGKGFRASPQKGIAGFLRSY